MATLKNEVSGKEETAVQGVATGEGGVGVAAQGAGVGVRGDGGTWHGVAGISTSTTGGAGVYGYGNVGVQGVGSTWIGVYGETNGSTNGPAAVWGEGKDGGDGVKGHANGPGKAGVIGIHLSNRGPGVYGRGSPAGRFEGDVSVTGNLDIEGAGRFTGDVTVTGDLILEGADYAESLTVADVEVVPGMVVILDEEGRIRPCADPYDHRVAGVVSGAGNVKPALVLDRHDGGMPVALIGKLWVMADATECPIRPGDLLTTSATVGHARRVTERERAFGAVVGKALTGLPSGVGMIRVLVTGS